MSQPKHGDGSSGRNQRILNSSASNTKAGLIPQFSKSVTSKDDSRETVRETVQDCLDRAMSALSADDIVKVMMASKTTQPYARDRVVEVVVAKVEESMAGLIKNLTEKEIVCGQLEEQVEELRTELNSERNLGAQMQAKMQEIRKESEKLQRKMAERQTFDERASEEILEYKRESEKLRSAVHQFKIDEINLKEQLKESQTSLKSVSKRESELENTCSALKIELTKLQSESSSMAEKIATLRESLAKEEIKNQGELSSLISQLNTSQASHTAEVASLKSEHKESQARLREEMRQLQARLDMANQDNEVSKNTNMREVHHAKKEIEESYEEKFSMMHTEYEEKVNRILEETDMIKEQFEERIRWFRDNTVKKEVYEELARDKTQLSTQLLERLRKQEDLYKSASNRPSKIDTSPHSQKHRFKFISDNATGINTALQIKLDHLELDHSRLKDSMASLESDLRRKSDDLSAQTSKNQALHLKLKEVTSELQVLRSEKSTRERLTTLLAERDDRLQAKDIEILAARKDCEMRIQSLEDVIDGLRREIKEEELSRAGLAQSAKEHWSEESIRAREAAEMSMKAAEEKIRGKESEIERLERENTGRVK